MFFFSFVYFSGFKRFHPRLAIGPLLTAVGDNDGDLLPRVAGRVVRLPNYTSQVVLAEKLERAMAVVMDGSEL